MSVSLLWLRRDLRLADHPALLAAHDAADEVLPVFVLDDALRKPAGSPRLAYLYRSLRALDESLDGRLVVRHGDPRRVLPRLAREVESASVHISADFGPYGSRRDDEVAKALADDGVELVRTGSPYAVAPGRVRKADGTPYAVFTPFSKAWRGHGWRAPASAPTDLRWAKGVASQRIPDDPDLGGTVLPAAGEAAAIRRWEAFRDEALAGYARNRDRPDLDASSRLSVHLKYGELHPRTLLAGLRNDTFRTELCWREFYADVLSHQPQSARDYLKPAMTGLEYDDPGPAFDAWRRGETGFPIVDAGMRQLLGEGWVHNRVRMIVASFLVKDLHVEWTHGARHFMQHLVDGDLASNQHGWQWVAGTGTDAAPFFRVFNPVVQGQKFDPHGDYVRTWVPELRAVAGKAVHEPWKLRGGVPEGYPGPIVDHAAERAEALRRYAALSG
jgi:deoxyribodipyrimidine photo-lyase